MFSGNDEFYLTLALNEAWKYQGLSYPNPAVACAIVNENGQLLCINAHKEAGSSHAELGAVKLALEKLNPKLNFPNNPKELHEYILKNHNDLLKNSSIYVTLEPCSHEGKTPSCALLLSKLKVKKVFIGTKDENKIASGGAKILTQSNIEVGFSAFEKKYHELIEPFLIWQKGNFSFFKLAMSINGVISGGIITGKSSRTLVHKLRSKCDSLLIGGNTIRIDRPTLDARLCKGKAPDVIIYSKRNDFDKNIPLFKVKNRKVFIENNFEKLNDYNFTMIEGGEGLLKAIGEQTKHFLIFKSSSFINNDNIKHDLNLQLLWQGQIGEDSFSWYKKV